ncbi:MAG TPA: molybdenum cofactor guanylyltransferase [Longimicrobiaceae bacterium]|jgi:molybdopterin-guanine dinucleotide biosynthesis protein A|nr:molybdenum cofactor guanylyltransferase [Longimicrobiaceae bacterium]
MASGGDDSADAGRGAGPLGVILAGGASRRFGSSKALAEVGGVVIVERVRRALAQVADTVVLVANEPEPFAHLHLPARPDWRPGEGPLAGVQTALRWAVDAGRPGALCVACDLPFVPPALLAHLAEIAYATGADVVIPESEGRRGIEPLCAYYSAACLPTVDDMLSGDERRLLALLDRVRTVRVPADEVRTFGAPDVIFLNVNTPADHARARKIASRMDDADA